MTEKTKALVTKGERTRQKIVETAAVLFNQRGFTGCSMADIVEASGLEKGDAVWAFLDEGRAGPLRFRLCVERYE
jgi:TetR/AcrR family transcriptional repressor of nem operon